MDCARQNVDGQGLLALLDGPVISEDAAPQGVFDPHDVMSLVVQHHSIEG